MPTKTLTIAVNDQFSNIWGKAYKQYKVRITGKYTSVKVHARLHPEPKNMFGGYSACDTYVGVTNDKVYSSEAQSKGYELYDFYDGAAYIVFAVLVKWLHVPYCNIVEATVDFTNIAMAENWITVLFDISAWGTGSGGTVELLEIIIEYPEGEEVSASVEEVAYGSGVVTSQTTIGAFEGMMNTIINLIPAIIILTIMVQIIGAISELGRRRE